MSDDLRARIAAVIQSHLTWDAPNLSGHLADAVIRELGLEPERRVGFGEPGEGLSGFIRYVTGWETDD